jgi:hypothetical protein
VNRLVLALATWLLATAAAAATTSDRSPVTQGMWWDPTKSGHGFEIFNASGQLSVFWYTYDDNGLPTWYTAQGALADAGTPFPLLRHKWANGSKAGYEVVGTLRLTISNPESAAVAYTLGSAAGSWTIEPFRVSGVVNEVDHDGVWFNPANPGWGLSVLEQGDILGGAIYFYTPEGNPTWVAGFTQGSKAVQYYSYRGTCPSCAYGAPTATSAGTATFDFAAETAGHLHSALTVTPAAGVAIDGASIAQLGRPASMRPADRQLVAYDGAESLKSYVVKGVANVPVPSCIACAQFSPAPPAVTTAFSTTNVQEPGVDEADFVKTDGRFLYTFQFAAPGTRQPIVRVGEILGDAAGVALRGTQALASGASSPMASAGLVLAGTQLVAVTGSQPAVIQGNSGWASSTAWSGGTTNVEIMDAAAAPALATRWHASFDGHPIATRRIGDRLYVASRYVPLFTGTGTSASAYANNATLESLLPKMRINGGNPVAMSPSDVLAPPPGAAVPVADFIVVATIDLAAQRVVQRVAILGAAEALYVSPGNAYVATGRRMLRNAGGFYIPQASTGMDYTDLHQLAFTPEGLTFVGSGTVIGTLGSSLDKAPYRFSEYAGKLRVVTSSLAAAMPLSVPANRNSLAILEPSNVTPGVLKTVAVLPNAQRPQPLGAPNEELFATRYVGDKLYAVTFPRFSSGPTVDPLYVVDLAVPADPAIRGELIVPGYSDYLHPLGNGLLLGIGRQMTSDGSMSLPWDLGLQLSLFDVGNPDQPKVLQQVNVGMRGSDSALFKNAHAFSIVNAANGGVHVAFPAFLTGGFSTFGLFPWIESSLLRYDIRTTPGAAQIVEAPRIKSEPNSTSGNATTDHAANNGRSIVFGNGAAIYVGDGWMWYQDAVGAKQGPF